jgi:putative lipoic acid-binding regulatory protein
MKKDYAKLRSLLEEQETFPLSFTYKFIGFHTPAFHASVSRLERAYPALTHEMDRESSGGKHLAKTYRYEAPDARAIIEIFQSIEKLDDLVIVL